MGEGSIFSQLFLFTFNSGGNNGHRLKTLHVNRPLIVDKSEFQETFFAHFFRAFQYTYRGCVNKIRSTCRDLYYQQIVNEEHAYKFSTYNLQEQCRKSHQRKVCRGIVKRPESSTEEQISSTKSTTMDDGSIDPDDPRYKQESIPVGCVPPVCQPYLVVPGHGEGGYSPPENTHPITREGYLRYPPTPADRMTDGQL